MGTRNLELQAGGSVEVLVAGGAELAARNWGQTRSSSFCRGRRCNRTMKIESDPNSARCGCLQVTAGGALLADEPFGGLDEFVDGESESFVDVRERRRRAKAIDAHDDAVAPHPAMPRHRMRGFDRDALHAGWQHLRLILRRLRREQLVARHADSSGTNAIRLELRLR